MDEIIKREGNAFGHGKLDVREVGVIIISQFPQLNSNNCFGFDPGMKAKHNADKKENIPVPRSDIHIFVKVEDIIRGG